MSDEFSLVSPKLTLTERAATSMSLMVVARISMMVIAVMLPVSLAVGGWAANRIVDRIDKMGDKQETLDRSFASLNQQVLSIVSAQVQNSRNIAERIDTGEKMLNDRITAQGNWLQTINTKLDELSKYVYTYTKVR